MIAQFAHAPPEDINVVCVIFWTMVLESALHLPRVDSVLRVTFLPGPSAPLRPDLSQVRLGQPAQGRLALRGRNPGP